MLFCLLLFLLFISIVALLNIRRCIILEATDGFDAGLLDGRDVGFLDAITAAFRGKIKAHIHGEMDSNVSIPHLAYRSANTNHPPLAQAWEETAAAAVSSTRELIDNFKHSTGPDEVLNLDRFIRCVTLLTFLRIFFRLPIDHTKVQEVVWIIGESLQTDGCWKDFVQDPLGLCRLVRSPPNPSGVFAVLSTTQRLVLSALCLLEHRRDTIQLIRQARDLLQHPASSGSAVIELVGGTLRSHPPVQSVRGCVRLSLGYIEFSIPVDILPPSACIIGPDGGCISWLHKAALPSQPECGGREWLIRTAAVILSAVKTEIRQAGLTVDGDEHDPEAWEQWALRRLRV